MFDNLIFGRNIMKQKLKIIMLLVFAPVLLCGIAVLQVTAQESQKSLNIGDLTNFRLGADKALIDQLDQRTDEAEQIRREIENQERRQQLGQMNQDIERLRQIMKEAEEIRARIARESQLNDAFRPQPQPQLQRQNLRQLPSSAPGIMEPRPDTPALSRPGVQRIIDNIPQMIDQLREAFNNNIERVHNTYQRIQEKMINLQSENERLRIENQQLRDENQRLRNRLQEIEPRRAPAGQVDTFGQP
jgi:cell shape-determining protein MreC